MNGASNKGPARQVNVSSKKISKVRTMRKWFARKTGWRNALRRGQTPTGGSAPTHSPASAPARIQTPDAEKAATKDIAEAAEGAPSSTPALTGASADSAAQQTQPLGQPKDKAAKNAQQTNRRKTSAKMKALQGKWSGGRKSSPADFEKRVAGRAAAKYGGRSHVGKRSQYNPNKTLGARHAQNVLKDGKDTKRDSLDPRARVGEMAAGRRAEQNRLAVRGLHTHRTRLYGQTHG